MTSATKESVYRRFAAIHANSLPIRDEKDLEAAVRAAGLSWDSVTDDWLRALERRWVHFDSESPFGDERQNREYRRLLSV